MADENLPQYVDIDTFNKFCTHISKVEKAMKGMNESALTVDKLVEIGLFEKADDGTVTLKSAAPVAPAVKPTEKTPEWQTEINNLKAQLAARDAAIDGERQKAQTAEMKQTLIGSLAKAGAVNAELAHQLLLPALKKNASGAFVFSAKDEYGVESEVAVDAHVEAFLTAHPELKAAGVRPGAGTPPSTGRVGSKGTFTREQMKDSGWYHEHRADIASGKLTLAE